MYAKKSANAKVIAVLLAVALLLGCGIGGTIAWLLDKTDPVVNTFTTANIDITLTETWNTDGDDEDTEPDSWTAKLVPGIDIQKDPKVTVLEGSEDCWLFVNVTESAVSVTVDGTAYDFDDFIEYSIASGWTELDAVNYPGVYYREVSASAQDQPFYVLAGPTVAEGETADSTLVNGYVHIPNTVTKAMEDALEEANVSPVLTFTAYAVQKEGFSSASDAWAEAVSLENTNS